MKTQYTIECDHHVIHYKGYRIEVGINDVGGAQAVFFVMRIAFTPDPLEKHAFATLQQALQAIDKAAES